MRKRRTISHTLETRSKPCTRWFKVNLLCRIWRSPTTFEGGHVNSPSQKGHQQNLPGNHCFLDSMTSFAWQRVPKNMLAVNPPEEAPVDPGNVCCQYRGWNPSFIPGSWNKDPIMKQITIVKCHKGYECCPLLTGYFCLFVNSKSLLLWEWTLSNASFAINPPDPFKKDRSQT